MNAVLSALEIVLAIFCIVGLGMFLTRIGWLRDDSAQLLARLTTRVALPCVILNNMLTSFTAESLVSGSVGILISFASILASLGLGFLAGKLLRLPRERFGVFVCMFSLSNSVFIGVPVCRSLFGDACVPYALMYYIGNTTVFWSLGNALMRGKSGEKAGLRKTLGRLLPLPLISFFFSAALLLLRVPLPGFLIKATGYVGSLVTPLSLFYTGLVVTRMLRGGRFRWRKGYLTVILGRFVIAPGLMLLLLTLTDAKDLMRGTLLMQAAMPVMSQTPIVAADLQADEEYAAGGVTLTTALCLVFVPLYMLVLQVL